MRRKMTTTLARLSGLKPALIRKCTVRPEVRKSAGGSWADREARKPMQTTATTEAGEARERRKGLFSSFSEPKTLF
jgi:hypothetical protein